MLSKVGIHVNGESRGGITRVVNSGILGSRGGITRVVSGGFRGRITGLSVADLEAGLREI